MPFYKSFLFIFWLSCSFLNCQKENNSLQQSDELLAQISDELRRVFSLESSKNCNDFAQYTHGELTLENNTWNAGNLAAGSFQQCIFELEDSTALMWGWSWSYPDTATGINAYPQVIYGKKPWHTRSTTTALPLRLDLIHQLKVNYDLEIARNDGEYNLAYDIWITANGLARPEDIRFEFMIWEDAHSIAPFGNYYGTVDTSNGSYALYIGEPDWEPEGSQWTYLGFLRTQFRKNGVVDIDELLGYLIEQQIVPPEHYLSSIELGTEVGNSKGYAVLKQFEIILN